MSSRWLYGDAKPVVAPVLTAQAVAIGDFVGLSGGNIVRAGDTALAGAVATPVAPTVANSAVAIGSPLTNAPTNVKISYQFPWGEGALSPAGTATPIAGGALLVSGAALVPPAPALWTNIYVETSAGSGTFKLWGMSNGQSVLVTSYGAGPIPSASPVASTALALTQYNFAQTFLGQSAQAKDAANAQVYSNYYANVIRVDTMGVYYADLDTNYTFAVGDYFAPAINGGATGLQNQVLSNIGAGGPVSYGINTGLRRLATHCAVEAGTTQNWAKVAMMSVMMEFQR